MTLKARLTPDIRMDTRVRAVPLGRRRGGEPADQHRARSSRANIPEFKVCAVRSEARRSAKGDCMIDLEPKFISAVAISVCRRRSNQAEAAGAMVHTRSTGQTIAAHLLPRGQLQRQMMAVAADAGRQADAATSRSARRPLFTCRWRWWRTWMPDSKLELLRPAPAGMSRHRGGRSGSAGNLKPRRDPTMDRASSNWSSSATAWPAPARSRKCWRAAARTSSTSPCSATSPTATTTASCCRTS